MPMRNAWIYPVIAFLLLAVCFMISYGIAVYNNHVQIVWPYISDTGAIPPESCIFGLLLNLSAVFIGITLYLRHALVTAYFSDTKHKRRLYIHSSRWFMWLGFVAAFGMVLVANFQESSQISVHLVGALMAFGGGVLYGWCQTVFSLLSPRKLTAPWLGASRAVICSLATVCFVGIFARSISGESLAASGSESCKNGNSTPTICHHLPEDEGYITFLISSISEWCLGICFGLFFLSLAIEFSGMKVYMPKVQLKVCEDALHALTARADIQPFTTGNGEVFLSPQFQLSTQTSLPAQGSTQTSTQSYYRPESPPVAPKRHPATAFSYLPDMPNPFETKEKGARVYNNVEQASVEEVNESANASLNARPHKAGQSRLPSHYGPYYQQDSAPRNSVGQLRRISNDDLAYYGSRESGAY